MRHPRQLCGVYGRLEDDCIGLADSNLLDDLDGVPVHLLGKYAAEVVSENQGRVPDLDEDQDGQEDLDPILGLDLSSAMQPRTWQSQKRSHRSISSGS